jgi:DNA-binding response OmpR family regulator
MKILVVDDDLSILEALKSAMEIFNYEVEAISRGEKAVSCAKKIKPNIIILDYLLSGIDGRQITKELKRYPETKNIPIIMLSAHPQAPELAKSIGINEFIAKPFDLDELLNKVSSLIE